MKLINPLILLIIVLSYGCAQNESANSVSDYLSAIEYFVKSPVSDSRESINFLERSGFTELAYDRNSEMWLWQHPLTGLRSWNEFDAMVDSIAIASPDSSIKGAEYFLKQRFYGLAFDNNADEDSIRLGLISVPIEYFPDILLEFLDRGFEYDTTASESNAFIRDDGQERARLKIVFVHPDSGDMVWIFLHRNFCIFKYQYFTEK